MRFLALFFTIVCVSMASVTTTINKMPAAPCNGVTTAFTFTFKIPGTDTSQIKVIKRNTTTGAETTLTPTTDYTVSATNNNFSNGGTVTTTAAYSSDYTITIMREVPITQTSTFLPSSILRASTLESIYDRLVMQTQDLNERVSRSITVPATDTATSLELPDAVSRASKNLTFDSSGNAVATTVISAGSVSVTSFGESLLTTADATAARAVLDARSGLGVFDLNDYGATGNGVTNDYTAIAAAIAAAEAYPRGIVTGAPGTYITETQIDVTDEIILDLPGVIFKQADSAELSTVLNIDVSATDDIFINVCVDGNMDNNATSVIGCVIKDVAVSFVDMYVGAEECDIGVEVTGNTESNMMTFNVNNCGIGVYEFTTGTTESPDENTFFIYGHTNTTHYKKDNTVATTNKSTSIVHLSCETSSGDAVYIADNCTSNDYVCLSGEIRGCESNGVHVGTGGARVNFNNLYADGEDADWGVVIDSSSGITGDVTLSNFDGGVYVKACSYGNLGIFTSAIGGGASPEAALKLGVLSTSSAQRFTVKPGSVLYTNSGSYGVHLVQSYNTVIQNSYIYGLTYNVYFDTTSNNDTVYANGRSIVSGAETSAKFAAHSSATDPRLFIDGLYVETFTAADATPSTLGYNIFKTNNSVAGNITDFDKCYTGQVITLIGDDAGLTTLVQDPAKINLANGANCTLQNNDTIQLVYDGTDWNELCRMSSGRDMLLSVTTVALNADADTTIYTVPTGKRCVLTKAFLVAGANANSTDISIGQDTAETDFIGTSQCDNLDAQYDVIILAPVPAATPAMLKSYAAGTVIQAKVSNQAGGATNYLYLYGFLYN